MSLLNTVSRIAGGMAGGATRRRGTVPAARRPMGTGAGMGTGMRGPARGRRSTQAAAAGGLLSRFLRRR